jgi:hypothetical protein
MRENRAVAPIRNLLKFHELPRRTGGLLASVRKA